MINYQDKSNSREKGNIYLSSQFKARAPGDWEVQTTASHVVCTLRKWRARNAAAQPLLCITRHWHSPCRVSHIKVIKRVPRIRVSQVATDFIKHTININCRRLCLGKTPSQPLLQLAKTFSSKVKANFIV